MQGEERKRHDGGARGRRPYGKPRVAGRTRSRKKKAEGICMMGQGEGSACSGSWALIRSTRPGGSMISFADTTLKVALTPLSVRAARFHWIWKKQRIQLTAPPPRVAANKDFWTHRKVPMVHLVELDITV